MLRYNLGSANKTEYAFTWPLGDAVPESDKVKLVFRRIPRESERKILSTISIDETDERTRKTMRRVDPMRIDALYAESLVRIENVELLQPDGDPVPPELMLGNNTTQAKQGRLQNFMTGNFGLDVEVHGSFEADLSEWFSIHILRQTENSDRKKNLRTPPSDASAENHAPDNGAGSTPRTAATSEPVSR